jgi:16S rRNA (guanine527-N7)-methyltransferase
MDIIHKYFPDLTEQQTQQFEQLGPVYKEWNQKINVVSRKDIDHIYDHHILHSTAIAKFIHFKEGSRILDLGTGGGLPGIPLAILFPDCHFTLIDGTRKKIMVVNEIVDTLGLSNVTAMQKRAEELKKKFDFVVCRAVASLDKLVMWSENLIDQRQQNAWPNGLITLKGGNITEEMKSLSKKYYAEIEHIDHFFEEEYYKEKYLVYIQF